MRPQNIRYILIAVVFMVVVVALRKTLLQGPYAYQDIISKKLGHGDVYGDLPHAIPTTLSMTLEQTSSSSSSSSSSSTSSTTSSPTSSPTSSTTSVIIASNTSSDISSSPVKSATPAAPEKSDASKYSSKSPDSFDVVVNFYKDDKEQLATELNQIRNLQILSTYSSVRVFIYVKDEEVDLESLKKTFDTPHVYHHENKGRESSAFFTHISEHYDDLGAHVFFRQAHMHHYDEAIQRINDYLVPPSKDATQTGMLSLGWFERCLCTHCSDPWDGSRVFSRLPELYSIIHGQFCPDEVTLTYIGQFVVSRKRLLDNPKSLYDHMNEILMSEMDHWIHKDPHEGMNDSPNAPYFGHAMERCWMILFKCEDTKIADTCGTTIKSLLTARKDGDKITKCQCLDEAGAGLHGFS